MSTDTLCWLGLDLSVNIKARPVFLTCLNGSAFGGVRNIFLAHSESINTN